MIVGDKKRATIQTRNRLDYRKAESIVCLISSVLSFYHVSGSTNFDGGRDYGGIIEYTSKMLDMPQNFFED